jgi:hypothetical protein
MRSLVICLFLLLVVAQHAVLPPVPVDRCCESGEADSSTGCAKDCPLCACCMDRITTDTPRLGLTAPSPAPELLLPSNSDAPPSPESAEILHVPKSHLG